MLDKIIRGIIALIGVLLGYGVVASLRTFEVIQLTANGWMNLVLYLGVSFILELYSSCCHKRL